MMGRGRNTPHKRRPSRRGRASPDAGQVDEGAEPPSTPTGEGVRPLRKTIQKSMTYLAATLKTSPALRRTRRRRSCTRGPFLGSVWTTSICPTLDRTKARARKACRPTSCKIDSRSWEGRSEAPGQCLSEDMRGISQTASTAARTQVMGMKRKEPQPTRPSIP